MTFLSVFFVLIATFILPTPTSQLPHTRFLAIPHTAALLPTLRPPPQHNFSRLSVCVSMSCLFSPPARLIYPSGLRFFWSSRVHACDTAVNILKIF